jgi:Skp family chaperone for outer membrane proteins
MRIVFILALILTFAFPSSAQTEKAQSKVAVIYPEVFEDETAGIKDLIEVNRKLYAEFASTIEELDALAAEIVCLEKEIAKLQNVMQDAGCKDDLTGVYKEKYEKYAKLADEFKARQSAAKALYDRRKGEETRTLKKKIPDAVMQFSREKGYAVIFDATNLDSCFFFVGDRQDVTREFIKYYNENFGNTKPQ